MFKKGKSIKVKIAAAVLAAMFIIGAGPMDIIGNTLARSSDNSGGAVLSLTTDEVLKTVERVAGADAVEQLQNTQENAEKPPANLFADLATAQIVVPQGEEVVPRDKDNNEVVIEETLPQIGEASYYVDQEMQQFVAGLDIPENSKLMEQDLLESLQDLWFIKSFSGSGYQAVAMLNPATFEVQLSFINSTDAQKNFTLEVTDAEGRPLEVTEVLAIIKSAAKKNLTAEELLGYQANENASVEVLSALAENEATTIQPEEPVVVEPVEPTTAPLGVSGGTATEEKPEEETKEEVNGKLVEVQVVIIQEGSISSSAAIPSYSVPSTSVFTGLFGGITPFGLNHDVQFIIDGQPYGEKVRVASGSTIAEKPAPPNDLWPSNTTEFSGWFLEGATQKFNFTTPITENMRLYAKFVNVYIIEYKAPNGELLDTKQIMPNAQIPEPGADVIAGISPPEGKRLVYWYDEEEGEQTPFVFGTTATKDMVLKPYFSNEFYVIFMSEGTQVNPQSVVGGEKAKEPVAGELPTREGFTFKYWATEAGGGTDKKFDFNTPIKDNTILYAVWEAQTVGYTVVYWVEQADFTGDPGTNRANYNYAASAVGQGVAGSKINIEEATADSYITHITSVSGSVNPLRYSEFRHSDKDAVIVGNGSTTINVYYKRIEYTYDFYVNANIGTDIDPTYVTIAYNDSKIQAKAGERTYTMKAKFQQDIAAFWPSVQKCKAATNDFIGWAPDKNVSGSFNWSTHRYLFSADMINQKNPKNIGGYVSKLYTLWQSTAGLRFAEYHFEGLNGEGVAPTGRAANILAIKNSFFERNETYDVESAYTGNPLNPKDIDGFRRHNNWYDGEDGAGETKKFYYLRNKSDIIFDAKGGEIDGSDIYTITDIFFDMPLASYMPNDPIREGYKFAGWYRDDKYNEAFDIANSNMPKIGLRLFAKWEATEFMVTYYSRLGAVSMLEEHGYGKNEYVKHPATLYNKGDSVAGYGIFEGWFWIVPGTNIFTEFSLDIPVSRDIDLYATWKTAGFKVTYELGRGEGTAPSDQGVYDMGRNVALKAATGITPPTGEIFYGWSLKGASESELYYPRSLYKVDTDTTFIAQFGSRDNAWQLTFDPGYDGSTESPITWFVPKGASVYLLDGAFTHPNATIIGWSETKGATTVQYNFEQLLQINSNKTLYAVWNIRNYNIYFQTDTDKGTLIDTGVDINGTVQYADIPYGILWSTAITRGVPQVTAKAGYKFVGWSPAIPADNSIISSDKTYIAQYLKQTAITITADSATKDYDGTPLTKNTVITTGLNTGLYKVEAAIKAGCTITNVGNIANTIQSYKIIEKATDKDVTDEFTITVKAGTLTVNKAAVTVTANNKTMQYGGTIPGFTATVEHKPTAGVDVNYKLSCAYTATQGVGTYDIIAEADPVKPNPNYTVTYKDGELTVTQNTTGMTAAVKGDKTVTYNGNTHKIDVVVTGPAAGTYTIKYSLTAGGTYGAHPVIKDVTAGTTIYFEVSHPNYATVKDSGKLIINKAKVEVTADNKTMAFGGTIPGFTATVKYKPTAGDNVNYKLSCAYTATQGVGSYPIIAAESAANPNYTVEYVNGTLTVTQNTTGMTAAVKGDKTVTYNGNAHKIDVVVTGPTTGYTIKYSATENGAYGAHPSMINATSGTLVYFKVSHPNYNDATGSGKLIINKAKVEVTADNKTMAFGGTIPGFTATVKYKPNMGDNVNYKLSCGYTAAQGVGTYDIIAEESLVNPNYTVTYKDGKLTVTQNTTGMTAKVAGDKIVTYDGNAHKIDVVVTGPAAGTYTIKYSLTAGGTYGAHPSMINATSGTLVYFKVSHPNYNDATGSGKLIINKAKVEVTADNKTMAFGGTIPGFTATVKYKPNMGDNVNYKLSCGYTAAQGVGTYDIIAEESLVNPNYTVTYKDGKLTVTQNTTGMTAAVKGDKIVTYDGNAHKIDVAVTGPTTGYTIKYSLTEGGYGAHPVIKDVTAGTTIYFEVSHKDYATVKGSGKLTINPAAVSVTANNETMQYGGTIPAFDATVGNKPNMGDNVNYKLSCGYTAAQGVGTYDIIAEESLVNPNYTVTYKDGKLTVTQNTTGMTAAVKGDKTVTYDGNAHKIDVVVTGPAAGTYTIKYSLTEGGYGAHPIMKNVADSGVVYFEVTHPNYETVTGSGKLTIKPAAVTVTANNEIMQYGGTIPTFDAAVSDKPTAGVDVNYKLSCVYTANQSVGTYDIIAEESLANPNYEVTYKEGTLTVTQNTTGMTAAVKGDKIVTYNGNAHKIDVVVTGPTTGYTIKYSATLNGNYTVTHPSKVNVADSGLVYFEVTHPNYETVKGSGKLTINPAAVSVTANNETMQYGGTIPGFTATVEHKPTAGVDVNYKLSCVYTANQSVGTYDIIAAESLANPNYTVTYKDGELAVTQNTDGMTAAVKGDKTVTYNGNAHKIDVVVTGPTTGYTIKYSATLNGNYTVTHPSKVNVADSGLVYFEVTHPNYETVKDSGKLIIKPAAVTVTANDKTMQYGGTIPAFTATVGSKPAMGENVNYKLSCAYDPTTQGVGTYDIIAEADSTKPNPNYAVTYKDGELAVTQNAGGMTAKVDGEKIVTYNGNAHEIDVVVTGPTTGYTIKYSATLNGNYTVTHPIMKNVADGALVYFKVSHPNYNDATGSGKLIINKAKVEVTADNKTMAFGGTIPTFDATVGNKPNMGDNVNYKLSCGYTATQGVGTYDIIAAESAANPNYTVTYKKGTLTVNKISGVLEATAAAKTVTYNAQAHKIDVVVTGATGYTIKYSTTLNGNYTVTHPSKINVADSATVYFEVTHPNYTTARGSATLTINKMNITITANNNGKARNAPEENVVLTATIAPAIPAGGSKLIYTVARVAGEDIRTYPIIVTAPVASNPNYAITAKDGIFTIGKIQLIIKIIDCEKLSTVARDPVFVGALIYGKLDGNDRVNRIGITYSREPGIVAGKYKITGTILSDKYEVQFAPGTLTIKPGTATPKK